MHGVARARAALRGENGGRRRRSGRRRGRRGRQRAPRRASSGACSTKDAAKAAAALAGCRTLRKLGVLDAHLLVAGRARLRRELLADHRPPTRSTRRASAVAAKEVHVRSFRAASPAPPTDGGPVVAAPMSIGGAPSTLALLLPAEAPRDPFVVRGDSVQLTMRSLLLDDDEQRLVVEWLRGSLDLVMRVSPQAAAEREKCGAEPGEPLDASLGAPQRLIAHTLHGAYEAARLDAATGAAAAPAAEATAAKLAADARRRRRRRRRRSWWSCSTSTGRCGRARRPTSPTTTPSRASSSSTAGATPSSCPTGRATPTGTPTSTSSPRCAA